MVTLKVSERFTAILDYMFVTFELSDTIKFNSSWRQMNGTKYPHKFCISACARDRTKSLPNQIQLCILLDELVFGPKKLVRCRNR